MRVSVLETETEAFKSQSQLSRSRLWTVRLDFETETEKLLMDETETRIWTIFKTKTTWDRPLDVKIEAKTESPADFWDNY